MNLNSDPDPEGQPLKYKQNRCSKIFQINSLQMLWQMSINKRKLKGYTFFKYLLLLYQFRLHYRYWLVVILLLSYLLDLDPDPGGLLIRTTA